MAKPFPPTKPLAEMTKDELFELAQEHQIPGRHDMKKADLLAAVEEALTAPDIEPTAEGEADGTEPFAPSGEADTEEGDPSADSQDELNEEGPQGGDAELDPKPEESKGPADPAELAALEASLQADAKLREQQEREAEQAKLAADEEARRVADAVALEASEKIAADRAAAHAAGQLTDDDRRDLMRAPADALEDLLEDETVPQFVQDGVRAEQERRKRQATLDNATRLMQSPNKQFKIVSGPAGMRYVTPTAYVTTLPVGSIVTPLAYDLKHVAEQGFTWEPIKGVEIREDQLGNQVSTAK